VTRAVRAEAPVRVADVGGWTDTWFGSPGRVCHLAMGPGVVVEARLVEVEPGVVPSWDPLVAHAVDAVLETAPLADGLGIELTVSSGVPPGSSVGTSASVLVAVVSALDALVGDGSIASDGPSGIAELAHRVETERAGREAGVQDQWAAAFGGAELLSINPYPSVARTPVPLDPSTVAELDERLVTVVFEPHDSSTVHGHVITDMTTCSSVGHDRSRQALRDLSVLAGDAAAALGAGDLDRWGAVLTAGTEAQRHLRAELVGAAHERAIALASAVGATGWKVNGAGGEGGSLTILAADRPTASALKADLASADPGWTVLDLRVAEAGVTVRPA
jgi:D-glycero-alpha-D-manno-heptose-7-phosphate kinase